MPPEVKVHLKPTNAGPVVKPDHSQFAHIAVLGQLPKLQSIILKLHAVRRGIVFPWKIKKFEFSQPDFATGKQLVAPGSQDQSKPSQLDAKR